MIKITTTTPTTHQIRWSLKFMCVPSLFLNLLAEAFFLNPLLMDPEGFNHLTRRAVAGDQVLPAV
jgi:hypothetical protein